MPDPGSQYTAYGQEASEPTRYVEFEPTVIEGRAPSTVKVPYDPDKTDSPLVPEDQLSGYEQQLAYSMYQEHRSLRGGGAGEAELAEAVQLMAAAVRTSKIPIGKQTAKPVPPTKLALENSDERAAWERAVAAAKASRNLSGADINKFVLHLSDDGRTPTKGMGGQQIAPWAYDYAKNIVMAYGPFRNKKQPTGDVPTSDRVFIFFYSGVP